MGLFRQFPYSNFHDMNMDELIKIVRQLADEWLQYQDQWQQLYTDTQQALTDFQQYVYDYFENLDLQDEVNHKLDIMVSDGTFNNIVLTQLTPVIESWLAAHITQDPSVVIDSSLTIAGAAADSKAAGDAIDAVHDNLVALAYTALARGYIMVTNNWIIGNLGADGEISTTNRKRVSTPDYLTAAHDLQLVINTVYRVTICTYNQDHSLNTRTPLPEGTQYYTIPAGTIYRLTVYKTGDPETVTDIYRFASGCLINSDFKSRVLYPTFASADDFGFSSVQDIDYNKIYYLSDSSPLADIPVPNEAGIIFKITSQNPLTAVAAWMIWIGYSGTVAVKTKTSQEWYPWHYHNALITEYAARLASEGKQFIIAGTWARGNLNASGVFTADKHRVSTVGYFRNPSHVYTRLYCDTGYTMAICEYDDNHVFVRRTVPSNREYIVPPNTNIRVTIYEQDTSGDVPLQNVAKLASHCYMVPLLDGDYSAIQIFDKICGIGDSLMGGYTSVTVDNVTYTKTTAEARAAGKNWLDFIGKRNTIEIVNEAIGGSTAHDWRYTHLGSISATGSQLFIVGLGVNDILQELPIGSTSDIMSNYHNNADTFYGNYHYILSDIMANFPNARIITVTIPHEDYNNIQGINDAIKTVTAMVNGCTCIDLYAEIREILNTRYFITNRTNSHYNPRTYAYISVLMEQAINQEIIKNPIFQTAPYWAWNINTLG